MRHPAMMKSHMKKMGAPKTGAQKGISGPSDLVKALGAARPAKASRLSSMKSKMFGRGGM